MKSIYFLLFTFFISQTALSQDLGLNETIDYINQSLINNPAYKDAYSRVIYQIDIDNGMFSVYRENKFTHTDGVQLGLIDKFSIPLGKMKCLHPDKTWVEFPGHQSMVTELIYIACDSCPNPNDYGSTKCIVKEYYATGSFGFKDEDRLIDKDFFYYKRYGLLRNEYFSKYKDGKYAPYPSDGTYLEIPFNNNNEIKENLFNAFEHLVYLLKQEKENDPFGKRTNNGGTATASVTGKKNIVNMIKNRGGTYEIPVQINGVLKINFIFDSGASDVSISPDVALTLIKTGTITSSDFMGTQKYVFADGTTATSSVFIIKNLKIGNKTVYNIRASISNSIDAPMLLGQSVLQKFGKFTVDNSAHTISLE